VHPLHSLAIHKDDINDGRDLAKQTQYVEAMAFVRALAPGQLHRPLKLVADVVEKALDLARGGARLGSQALADRCAIVVIAKPRLDRSVREQRHDNRDEERDEVLPEERASQTDSGFRRNAHSIRSSARS
jgi:hypothetical protein